MYIHFFDILLIFLKIRFTTPNFQIHEDFSIFLWGCILQNDPKKLSLDSHWIRKNANPCESILYLVTICESGFASSLDSRIQIRNESRDSHKCESLNSHRIWVRESRVAANPGIRILRILGFALRIQCCKSGSAATPGFADSRIQIRMDSQNLDSHGFAKIRSANPWIRRTLAFAHNKYI